MIQPTVQMIRYGKRGDVWELQTTGSGCFGIAGEHYPRAVVKTEATSRGTAYLCIACASIWLDPDAMPPEASQEQLSLSTLTIERLTAKLQYVCAELQKITGDKEGSPIEAYARSAVSAFERLTRERDTEQKAHGHTAEQMARLLATSKTGGSDCCITCAAHVLVINDLQAERDRYRAALDAVQAKLAEYLERLIQRRTLPNRWVGEINDIVVAAIHNLSLEALAGAADETTEEPK